MEWQLHIRYKSTYFDLKAEVEYQSNQIIRIRVHGTRSSILLESDMPLIRLANSRKAIKWKLREGGFDSGNADTAALLVEIISKLEQTLDKDFSSLYPEYINFRF